MCPPEAFSLRPSLSKQQRSYVRARLANVDLNQITTGTIDSICEEVLHQYRDPGLQPPVLVDDFVSKTLLLREGLFSKGRHQNDDLDAFFLEINGGNRWGWHIIGKKNDILHEIWQHRFQDQVDWEAFISGAMSENQHALEVIDTALAAYDNSSQEQGVLDFTLLEQEMLNRLQAQQLGEFMEQLRVILVDEYQDANLLQESIYFALAQACEGALNVVGNDDQSLYRFRGATVGLFRDFAVRYAHTFGKKYRTDFPQHQLSFHADHCESGQRLRAA